MRGAHFAAAVALLACGHDEETLLPDLVLDGDTLATDLSIDMKTFAETGCELSGADRCVSAAGRRKLLRFSVVSVNAGTADLVLGDPRDRPGEFEFSTCHQHYHLLDYATYELVAAGGDTVAAGHKQAFCLHDSIRVAPGAGDAEEPRYTCEDQGLQRGWGDLYDASVPCQWIDITGVPDGDYDLRVRINPAGLLEELDVANNEARTPVRVGSPALETPTEACDPALNPDALAGSTRECGWTRAAEWECTPDAYIAARCGPDGEDGGSCSGDAMIRLCDAAAANCTVGASLASATPEDGVACPHVEGLRCPASGRVVAFTGSVADGGDYGCDVAFHYL